MGRATARGARGFYCAKLQLEVNCVSSTEVQKIARGYFERHKGRKGFVHYPGTGAVRDRDR